MILFFVFLSSVADIESLYIYDEYDEIIEQAPLVLLDTTLSKSEIIDVNKYYAISLTIMGRQEDAIKIFHRLLNLKPDFTLDPIRVSPKIINVFNKAKVTMPPIISVTEPIRDTIYLAKKIPLTMLVPGICQIQNNKKIKGFSILAAQMISLAGLGVSQYYYNKYHDEYVAENDPLMIHEKYDKYNNWYRTRLVFISTSTIIWLYNVIDVLYFQ